MSILLLCIVLIVPASYIITFFLGKEFSPRLDLERAYRQGYNASERVYQIKFRQQAETIRLLQENHASYASAYLTGAQDTLHRLPFGAQSQQSPQYDINTILGDLDFSPLDNETANVDL